MLAGSRIQIYSVCSLGILSHDTWWHPCQLRCTKTYSQPSGTQHNYNLAITALGYITCYKLDTNNHSCHLLWHSWADRGANRLYIAHSALSFGRVLVAVLQYLCVFLGLEWFPVRQAWEVVWDFVWTILRPLDAREDPGSCLCPETRSVEERVEHLKYAIILSFHENAFFSRNWKRLNMRMITKTFESWVYHHTKNRK